MNLQSTAAAAEEKKKSAQTGLIGAASVTNVVVKGMSSLAEIFSDKILSSRLALTD
jgi:hypothetical protein